MKKQEKIDIATRLIFHYGSIDGAHHKQWVLSQVLLTLLGKKDYIEFLENDPDWDHGIAP